MAKIVKNNTASPLEIADTGVTIAANGQHTITSGESYLWTASNDLVTALGAGNATINDGTYDLSNSDGLDLIKGIFQKNRIIGDTDGSLIGNVGDKIKTHTTLDPASAHPVTLKPTSGLVDAFGRLRVSNPYSIFDNNFPIDKNPLIFTELTANGGTATHDTNKKAVILTATTTTNSSVKFQTRQYFKYHPGKSQLVILTGNFKEYQADVNKYLGQFDDDNGYFFKVDSTVKVGIRSKVSGSVVDTEIAQANWNLDKLDGTGSSGKTLDITKQQIFIIDYQWLGSGRVRFGFNIDGEVVYCHQFIHANILTTIYTQSADLPVRAEIKNTVSSTSTLEFTCATVIAEGGFHPDAIQRGVSNGSTSRSFSTPGTQIPILCLRKQSSYIKHVVDVVEAGVFAPSTDDFLIEIYMNPTITGGSWVTTGMAGICEVNRSAASISGGTMVSNFYVRGTAVSGSVAQSGSFKNSKNIVLGCDLAGNSDTIAIVATNLTQTAVCLGYLNYGEWI